MSTQMPMPPKLTKEQLQEQRARRKADREHKARQKQEEKIRKGRLRSEIQILKFMLKTDVLFHHHSQSESMKSEIKKRLERIKKDGEFLEYNQYSLLGCHFSSREFSSINQVPLDGTHRFEIYDSGERGLGAFRRMTAVKVEEKFQAPYVNPGAIVPITAD